MAAAWQEIAPRGRDALEGRITLSVATTTDGRSWSKPNRAFFPEISYKMHEGGIEPRVYSMTVDARGRILVAVARAERGIAVLESGDGGRTFQSAAVLGPAEVLVAPNIFNSATGGFILLAARSSATLQAEPVALVVSTSADGRAWSPLVPLVAAGEPGAGLQLQPDHAVVLGRDFIVFQSQEEQLGYQLYIKQSSDGGRTWTPARPITTGEAFAGAVGSVRYGPREYSNQRPRITATPEGLVLAWERNLVGDSRPQVYFCRLDAEGAPAGTLEQVSTGTSGVFARIVAFRGKLYVLYADSTAAVTTVNLAERVRGWDAKPLDSQGTSQFPHAAILGDSLYLFWERESAGRTALVARSPDTTVAAPTLAGADPAPGSTTGKPTATVRWNRVQDPSGVREYRYSWAVSVGGRSAVKRSGSVLAFEAARLSSEADLTEDGTWTFTVTAVDVAGNIGPALSFSFVRDTAAPGAVRFAGLEPGVVTPLPSNDVTLTWSRPAGDVASYLWVAQNLAPTAEDYLANPPAIRLPPSNQVVATETKSFQNLENGVWAFTVQPVDAAGNVGPAATVLALLEKKVPLAVIWSITGTTDEFGTVTMAIRGKGFRTAGTVQQVVLDRDGAAPFDLVFGPGGFAVESDGRIRGPSLTNDTPPGSYRVGIVHPTRGPDPWFFPPYRLAFRAPGTMKIGNFEIELPSWTAGRIPGFTVPMEALLVVALVAFLAVLVVLAARRVTAIAYEGAMLTSEVTALIEGRPSAGTRERERRDKRMKELRRKGAGLRLKFTLLVVVLVILVILIVAVPLGYQMRNNQQEVLATGLQKQGEILIGSIASAATSQIKLRSEGYATIVDVPSGRKAMPEALYATITGPRAWNAGEPDPNTLPGVVRDFVWASDEKSWTDSRAAGTFKPAVSLVEDVLVAQGIVAGFQKEIEDKLQATVGPLVSRYLDLRARRRALEAGPRRGTAEQIAEVRAELGTLGKEIDRALAEQVADLKPLRSYPAFQSSTPVDQYIFYYPIVYFDPDDSYYYHGLVRLAVGTERIRASIARAQIALVQITGAIALLAVALGVAGAIILASITVTPIRRLVKGVARIRDEEDKENLKTHVITVGTRDEIGLLADTVNEMTQGLVKAAAANKELLIGKDIQKKFLPLQETPAGAKGSTAEEESDLVGLYGYYEGARVVSGDYFDFKKLDQNRYALIKCDVSGKAVSGALIMVEVATLFTNYFVDWRRRAQNIAALKDAVERRRAEQELARIDRLVYTINDRVEERKFAGRFAALTVCLYNAKTGVATICNAGDTKLHLFKASQGRMIHEALPAAPAAGVFDGTLVDMKGGFRQVDYPLAPGDVLFLYTDGFEEAKRHLRNSDFEAITCDEPGLQKGESHEGTHEKGQDVEEFGERRMDGVLNAVFNRGRYSLQRVHNPVAGEELQFDFTTCEGSHKDAVLALAAVEKVYRMIPDPRVRDEDRVAVDEKIEAFLRTHFVQYDRYFSHRLETQPQPGYVVFSHAKEDQQYDDLTILVMKRK
jgi:serine phosphatase RsbU (regulator of sigma subunit)